MKKSRYVFLSFFLMVLFNLSSHGQQTKVDSLENLLNSDRYRNAKHDTTKLYLLEKIGRIYYRQERYKKALLYFSDGSEIAKRLNKKETYAKLKRRIGRIHYAQGDYTTAQEHYLVALDIYESNNIENSDLGWLFHYIGSVFKRQRNYIKACGFYQKQLEIANKMKDDDLKADALYLLSSCAEKLEDDPDKALALDLESFKLYEKLNDKSGMALQCRNVAANYENAGKYHQALEYYLLGLHYEKEMNDTCEISSILCDLADLYNEKKEYRMAFRYLKEAELYLPSVKKKRHLRYRGYYLYSYQAYMGIADYKNALKFHLLYSSIKDSVLNNESMKQVAEMETKYKTEKAERENEIFRHEKEIRLLKAKEEHELVRKKAEQESRRDKLQYSAILIFIVFLFIGMFVLGKFSIPGRLVEGITFFAFLLFFEFMLVVLDPHIDRYSSGAPAIKLGFNALLAGLIFPLHQFFESKLKQKTLKQKNEK